VLVILLTGVLFASLCVAVSVRRLTFAVELTPFDHARLTPALRERWSRMGADPVGSLRQALAVEACARWEVELLAALEHQGEARQAYLSEALTDLDARAQRWVRVPRVCASLSSSFGFLLATVALRAGLADVPQVPVGAVNDAINAGVFAAIDVVALGLAGAAMCVAVQGQARRAAAARLAAAVRFVEGLDGLAPADEGSPLA
jgi:hypothetical protein